MRCCPQWTFIIIFIIVVVIVYLAISIRVLRQYERLMKKDLAPSLSMSRKSMPRT